MRLLVLILLITTSITSLAGGDKRFPVSEIPDDLIKNAHAVIRYSDEEYEILDVDKAVYRVKQAVTIFSEKGKSLALVYEMYDELSKVNSIEAWVYDKDGNEIVKLRKGDINDQSYVSGFSLYEDNRVKWADMSQKQFPYTVYSEIEVTYDFLFSIRPFIPVPDENISVMEASYTLISDDELYPRFKAVNFPNDPVESVNSDGKKVTKWKITDLTAVETEPYGRSFTDKTPQVLISPSKFSFEGYEGDMSTWDSFGEWILSLNKDRNTLSEATKMKLQEMTKGMSDLEKVMAIYDYMQNKTRYVSIQLGIGGYQPFESGLVDDVGYGDCKALSFYTKSMLEAVGIPSNYVLVYAGDKPLPLYKDFPAARFNHAILAVPMAADTVWLECTSQTKPNGFLGSFTDNRDVLMITENGARIVRTPEYGPSDNVQSRYATIRIRDDGNAEASVQTRFKGIQYEYGGLSQVIHLGEEDQKKWIYNTSRIPHYELRSFQMTNHEDLVPYADVEMTMDLPKFSSIGGKRMFFEPNLMNQWDNPLPKTADRTEPVKFRRGLEESDSLVFEFPSHLRPEYLPDPVIIESEFGKYETHYEFIQGRLIYVRNFILYSGEYSANKYQDIFQFFNEVVRNDKKKVVLLNGT